MLFNSFNFILLYLPLTFAGFHLAKRLGGRQAAIGWLIAASLVFYAVWNPAHAWVPLISMVVTFVIARMMGRAFGRLRFGLLWLGIAFNVVMLGVFKAQAAGFFGGSAAGESVSFNTADAILIPLGISFIAFQQIAFLVDLYKERITPPSPLHYAFFLLFFPQLVMGPIVHYRDIEPQLTRPGFLAADSTGIAVGLAIFTVGLFKKVVLADGIAPLVNSVFAEADSEIVITWVQAWAAAVGFQLQVYFDFSGYADMTIGIGRLFNINLPINFDAPLRASNRYDLWRRWHITFAEFMRGYVFVPLQRNRFFRLPGTAAMIVTVFLSGLWHGLGWTFLLWGLLQGAILIWLHFYNQTLKAVGIGRRTFLPLWGRIAFCFLVTTLIGVLFRSNDLAAAAVVYEALASVRPAQVFQLLSDVGNKLTVGDRPYPDYGVRLADGLLIFVMAVIAWTLPTARAFFNRYWTALEPRSRPPRYANGLVPTLEKLLVFTLHPLWALAMAGLLLLAFLALDETSRFIYYQF